MLQPYFSQHISGLLVSLLEDDLAYLVERLLLKVTCVLNSKVRMEVKTGGLAIIATMALSPLSI